jgi:hypothetical protein
MQRSMFSLILAFFFSMAISVALSADQLNWSHKKTDASTDKAGCACDAPGVVGTVCATPGRCEEISGLCVGSCTNAVTAKVGCACDAPGIVGTFCATPGRCEQMSGLCVGGC